MFDLCLIFLFIIGSYNAVVGTPITGIAPTTIGNPTSTSITTRTTSSRPTTMPRPRGVNDALSCALDHTDLCGWSNHPANIGSWTEVKVRKSNGEYTPTINYLKLNMPEGLSLENRTALLISPLYGRDLERNGCFFFTFQCFETKTKLMHLFSRRFVGFRVYQKPEHLDLKDLLQYNDEVKKNYILFEALGNYGQWLWHGDESALKHFDDNFQIIIEGIFGIGPEQIAVADMAIRQGSECTQVATTPTTTTSTSTTSSTTTRTPRPTTMTDKKLGTPTSGAAPTTTGKPTPTSMTTTSPRPTTTTTIVSVTDYNLCAYDYDGFCLWENDPKAKYFWHLNPTFDFDDAKAGDEAALPYMYFDKQPSQGNGAVRFVSPYLFPDLHETGCFVFSYKMYTNSHSGRSVGIRVYQKPSNMTLDDFVAFSDDVKKDYILFEVWGDKGDRWYEQEMTPKDLGRPRSFNIIIEGVFDGPDSAYMAIRNVKFSERGCALHNAAPISKPTTNNKSQRERRGADGS